MLGQDLAVLFKLTLETGPRVLSKKLADDLFLPPSEVSKSLARCRHAGLLFLSDIEKRVNRSGLLEFLEHGVRYIFPPEKGGLVRGIPTGVAAAPLNAGFIASTDPPDVWPYSEGAVRGLAFSPLYKQAPRAALKDGELYELLALCDALRGGRARERAKAMEYLRGKLHA